MEDLQLTIELKNADTLRGLFPKEDVYNHVSLTLIGKMGNDDFAFLCGYSESLEIDEDTGEVYNVPDIYRWNTIDLDLSGIDPVSFETHRLNEIKGLRDVILPVGYKTVNISKYNWEDDSTHSVVISEGTKEIQEDSFVEWKSLEKVSFPSSLEWIASNAFVGCSSLQSFVFPEGSNYFKIYNGVLFSLDMSILIAFPPGLKIDRYDIPEGTTLIAEKAIKQNPFVKEITIPKTVVNIRAYAFENCASLKKIEVDSANPIYYSKNGILFERSRAELVPYLDVYFDRHCDITICVPAAIDRPRITIRKALLEAKCFSGCKNIKNVRCNGREYSQGIAGAFDGFIGVEEIHFSYVKELPRLIDCQNLKKLRIDGDIVGKLEYSISRNEELKKVNIYDNSDYYSIEGVAFTKDNELYFYPPCKENKIYVVPKYTKNIKCWDFNKNPYIREVILPPSTDLEMLKKEWFGEFESDNGSSFTINSSRCTTIRFSIGTENSNKIFISKREGRRKRLGAIGIIHCLDSEETIYIEFSLFEDEIVRIKELTKAGNCTDFLDIIKDEFPDLCEKINDELTSAAYALFRRKSREHSAECEKDKLGEMVFTGAEYSCVIPKDFN